MEVKILSKNMFIRDALPYVDEREDTFYISILEPDDKTPLRQDCERFMTVDFYDIEEDLDNGTGFLYKAITEKQAETLYNFIKSNSDKKKLITHCAAGVSRSGAVGAFVYEYFGGAYKELLKTNPNILPNGRVTRLLRMYERIDFQGDNKIVF